MSYFSDYPERVALIEKNAHLRQLAVPLEEASGEVGFYASEDEAVETWSGVLDEIGKFAQAEIRPTAEAIDLEGCKFENGEVTLPPALMGHLKRIAELGVFGGNLSRASGGLNLPQSVQLMALELFCHACPNTALTVACFSMGDFVEKWGTAEQKAELLPKIIANEWQTSMALTEPNAGSDLGKLRSSAVEKSGKWVINGTKQFITNGCGDVTFALVRTDPNSEGLKGLSVMVVPRKIDGALNYKVTKIEEKICLHASPTCELVFEDSVGELLGPVNDGFRVMADLMNGARTAMGALALGIMTASIEEAKKYGATRVTMGQPIIRHPMVADMLYEMEVETRAMRAMVIETGCAFDWMQIYKKKGDTKNFERWKKRYRRLTPLCKYMCSERAIVFARNSLQMFGGYGVCRDYPMERLLRETLIYPIYEGASQIQALMVLKDTLKDVATESRGFLGSLAGAWAESKVTRDPVKSKLLQARNELNQGIRTILRSIIKDKFKSDIDSLRESGVQEFLKEFSMNLISKRSDLTVPFLCAERFTRITCDYYALKCMTDNYTSGDKEQEKWIIAFANIALPRMAYENRIMTDRLPATLDYIETLPVGS